MSKFKLLIATTNAGKVREFRDLLGQDRFDCIGLADVPPMEPVEETGHTFRGNAMLKASGYARASGHWALADDSGLEVAALQNKPGIHSARWAEMHDAGNGDAANNELLLKELLDVPAKDRTARFVCVLALADPRGQVMFTTRDVMEGEIIFAPIGSNGFGYDPLFRVTGLNQTSAQLVPADKHRISHRGRALERMKKLLHRVELEPIAI